MVSKWYHPLVVFQKGLPSNKATERIKWIYIVLFMIIMARFLRLILHDPSKVSNPLLLALVGCLAMPLVASVNTMPSSVRRLTILLIWATNSGLVVLEILSHPPEVSADSLLPATLFVMSLFFIPLLWYMLAAMYLIDLEASDVAE